MCEPYKLMDLFAGAGGLSNGFEQTKQFKVIVAVENNKNAQKTYKSNHDNIKMFDDITEVTYKNQNGELQKCFDEIDIIIGGPPCQGFSNANRQKNTLISNNNQLVKEYLRAIENIEPIAFVMENVPSMESKKHKFYVSLDDLNELEVLGITTMEEEINIGKKTTLSKPLIQFLVNLNNDNNMLSNVVLPRLIYSKLNTLLKKLSNSDSRTREYINKPNNQSYFNKILKHWDQYHDYNWSEEYALLWNTLREYLKLYMDEQVNSTELYDNLETIIETQKVLSKYQEVLNQSIKYEGPFDGKNGVNIKLESYNVFNYIVSKLQFLGYEMNNKDRKVFNAADYGVPQYRKRLILMGIKKEELKEEEIKLPDPLIKRPNVPFNIYDAIKDLELIEPEVNVKRDQVEKENNFPIKNNSLNRYLNSDCKYIHNHVKTKSTKAAEDRFKALKEGENFHNLSNRLKSSYTDHTRTQNTVYKRLRYDEPSDTVVNVRKSMWIHPTRNRALSIREAARLQSFQDKFKFFGTKDSQYQQVGNAVPPLLARVVAESLILSLNEKVLYPLKNELNIDEVPSVDNVPAILL